LYVSISTLTKGFAMSK